MSEADKYWEAIPVTLNGKDVLTMCGILDERLRMMPDSISTTSPSLPRSVKDGVQAFRDKMMEAVRDAQRQADAERPTSPQPGRTTSEERADG